jgi:hypothetical protein
MNNEAVYTDLTKSNTTVAIWQRVIPKSEIPQAGKEIAERILEVEQAKPAYVRLYNVAQAIGEALSILKPLALSAVTSKEEILGAKVSMASLPKKWDYHGDSKLTLLEAKKKEIDAEIKAHQKFLQTLPSEMADPTTGEMFKPATVLEAGCTIKVEY